MREALLGVTLGWAAGVSPGPMLALVVSTTLRSGLGAGLRMSMVPLASDAPIVAVAVAFAGLVPERALTWLTFLGGGYLIWLGVTEVRSARHAAVDRGPADPPIGRGVLINLLSPHPWLFWLTVGAPILLGAWRREPASAVAFLGLFYLMIVVTKMAVAWLAARARRRLTAAGYRRAVAAGGWLMIVLGVGILLD